MCYQVYAQANFFVFELCDVKCYVILTAHSLSWSRMEVLSSPLPMRSFKKLIHQFERDQHSIRVRGSINMSFTTSIFILAITREVTLNCWCHWVLYTLRWVCTGDLGQDSPIKTSRSVNKNIVWAIMHLSILSPLTFSRCTRVGNLTLALMKMSNSPGSAPPPPPRGLALIRALSHINENKNSWLIHHVGQL